MLSDYSRLLDRGSLNEIEEAEINLHRTKNNILMSFQSRRAKVDIANIYKGFLKTIISWAQLFEGRLALNPGFFFLCSKAFSRIIFCAIFRAFDHQLVDKKN